MTTTMKGLLKGLRYISQIFEADDEEDDEPEMQIGNPTDVKHVAHIGLDGPSSNSPSWMNDFSENQTTPRDKLPSPKPEGRSSRNADVPKPNRRHPSLEIINPDSLPDEHKSRRRHSAGGALNSPGHESPDGSKAGRRHHHSHGGTDSSPSHDGAPPKHSKKKKSSKGSSSSGGGSVRGGSVKSRSKAQQTSSGDYSSSYLDPGAGSGGY